MAGGLRNGISRRITDATNHNIKVHGTHRRLCQRIVIVILYLDVPLPCDVRATVRK